MHREKKTNMKKLEVDLLRLFKEKKDRTVDQIIQLIMGNCSLDKELILKTIKKLRKNAVVRDSCNYVLNVSLISVSCLSLV